MTQIYVKIRSEIVIHLTVNNDVQQYCKVYSEEFGGQRAEIYELAHNYARIKHILVLLF